MCCHGVATGTAGFVKHWNTFQAPSYGQGLRVVLTEPTLAQHLYGVPGSVHGDPGDCHHEGLRSGEDEAQEFRQAGSRGGSPQLCASAR